MSDRDSELNKYSILVMTVIFKGLTCPIFERVSTVLHVQVEYKLGGGRISGIFSGLI